MADAPGETRTITDPGDAVLSLARDRFMPTATLCDEIHQVWRGNEVFFVRVQVSGSTFQPVRSDLGGKLADVIRAEWPAEVPDA